MTKSSGIPMLDVMTKGHEEGHALEHFGLYQRISTIVEKQFNKYVNLESENPEVIAQIAGIVALERNGFPMFLYKPELLKFCYNEYKAYTREALQILGLQFL